MDKKKYTWQGHTLAFVEIFELQMMLKLVSFRLETQYDTTLHLRESCSQHGMQDCSNSVDNVYFRLVNSANFILNILLFSRPHR
jgi:hypothetical protein